MGRYQKKHRKLHAQVGFKTHKQTQTSVNESAVGIVFSTTSRGRARSAEAMICGDRFTCPFLSASQSLRLAASTRVDCCSDK